jgi:hypothetical protein
MRHAINSAVNFYNAVKIVVLAPAFDTTEFDTETVWGDASVYLPMFVK